MSERASPSFELLLKLALIAGGAYLAYQLYQQFLAGAKAVGAGVTAAAGAVAAPIANLWLSLTEGPPMGQVLGFVLFQDGPEAGMTNPLAQYAVRTDAQGNVYVNQEGDVYKLSPSDPQGNWPASFVQKQVST